MAGNTDEENRNVLTLSLSERKQYVGWRPGGEAGGDSFSPVLCWLQTRPFPQPLHFTTAEALYHRI